MKKVIITLVLFISTLSSYAQWELVKSFDKKISFIESTEQGLFVVTDSVYYLLNTASDSWTNFKINDKIINVTSKDSYLYLSSENKVYEHLNQPKKIHETTSGITSMNIYKGMKFLSLSVNSNSLFCTFSNPFGQFDTLDFQTTENIWPLMTVSSDDSIAFIGYSNYFGGKTYNETTKKWNGISPLENEVVYDSYVENGTIMARYSKAGTDFYISHDYGQTYTTQANVFPFNSSDGSTLEYKNGIVFIGYQKTNIDINGIYQSTNDGETWINILSGSNITDLAIDENYLYASTDNGTLLRLGVNTLVTSIENEESILDIFYSNNSIHNLSQEQIEFTIYDLNGKTMESGSVSSQGKKTISTSNKGLFILECKSGKIRTREKIYIW